MEECCCCSFLLSVVIWRSSRAASSDKFAIGPIHISCLGLQFYHFDICFHLLQLLRYCRVWLVVFLEVLRHRLAVLSLRTMIGQNRQAVAELMARASSPQKYRLGSDIRQQSLAREQLCSGACAAVLSLLPLSGCFEHALRQRLVKRSELQQIISRSDLRAYGLRTVRSSAPITSSSCSCARTVASCSRRYCFIERPDHPLGEILAFFDHLDPLRRSARYKLVGVFVRLRQAQRRHRQLVAALVEALVELDYLRDRSLSRLHTGSVCVETQADLFDVRRELLEVLLGECCTSDRHHLLRTSLVRTHRVHVAFDQYDPIRFYERRLCLRECKNVPDLS